MKSKLSGFLSPLEAETGFSEWPLIDGRTSRGAVCVSGN